MKQIILSTLFGLCLVACSDETHVASPVTQVDLTQYDVSDPVIIEAIQLINAEVYMEMEYSLRDKMNDQNAQQIAAFWHPNMTQDLTDSFVNALIDYDGGHVTPIMVAGLDSPNANTQATALNSLSDDPELWDKMYEGGWVQDTKVQALVNAYKIEHGLK